MAISGHATSKKIARYTKAARARLARNSMMRMAMGGQVQREIVMLKQILPAAVLSAALALMVASAHAADCKRGEPRCGVPLQKACTDPESG